MLKCLKIIRLLLHLLIGFATILYQSIILRRDANHPICQEKVRLWYQKACQIVGLQVTAYGQATDGPVLMVSNHISWLDIPLMASLCNPRFLSKAEVRQWPLIGWAAEKLNTLFIVRGQRSAAEAAGAAIINGLERCDRILIFPEGTTKAGDVIGFLYPRLFGAAIDTLSLVQPVVIYYRDDSMQGSSSELVPFIGEQTLFENLWGLLGAKNVQAEVHFLQAVESEDQSRRELSEAVQRSMQQCLWSRQNTHLALTNPTMHKEDK